MPDNACLITNEWGYLNGCSTLSSISETVQKAVRWLGEEPQLGGTPAPEQQDPCGKFPLLGADPVCLSGNDFADLALICHLLTPFKMKPATLGRVWSPVEPKAPQ